jgi:hypothetical protein
MAVDQQWSFKQFAERFVGHHNASFAAGDQSPVFD